MELLSKNLVNDYPNRRANDIAAGFGIARMTAYTEFVKLFVLFIERCGNHRLFCDAENLKLGIRLSVADVLLGIRQGG